MVDMRPAFLNIVWWVFDAEEEDDEEEEEALLNGKSRGGRVFRAFVDGGETCYA